MRVVQSVAELDHKWGELSDREYLARLRQTQLGQRDSVDKLHRHGGDVAVALEVMDAHDIGMRQPKSVARLLLELVDSRVIARDNLRQKLQRHHIAKFLVAGSPDHPHAALPQHGFEDVASEDFLPGGQSAHGRPVVGVVIRHTLGGVVVCHGRRIHSSAGGSIGNLAQVINAPGL